MVSADPRGAGYDLIDSPVPQYISINDKGNIGKILSHWPKKDEARISVVTDGKTPEGSSVGRI